MAYRTGIYQGTIPELKLPKQEEVKPKFDNSRGKVLRNVYKSKVRNIRSKGER